MTRISRHILFTVILFSGFHLHAQNLTGTWEGIMNDEFLQVNIIQENDELCGYTYDYLFVNPADHCKAYFKGYFDKNKDTWIITGTSFIENSGTHVLMRLKLKQGNEPGSNKMLATVSLKSVFDLVLSMGSTENVVLARVSARPAKLPGRMPTCFNQQKEPTAPVIRKSIPAEKPLPAKTADSTRQVTDTIKKITPPVAVIPQTETVTRPKKLVARRNTVFSRIPVTVKNITLKLYDNATVDGDTVSIYYNGKLLVNKQMLSERPIVINLELDENVSMHEITLYAENLGSIAPNTALVVVTAGDKRYELHSSSNLQENAVIVFEYTPK